MWCIGGDALSLTPAVTAAPTSLPPPPLTPPTPRLRDHFASHRDRQKHSSDEMLRLQMRRRAEARGWKAPRVDTSDVPDKGAATAAQVRGMS